MCSAGEYLTGLSIIRSIAVAQNQFER